MERSGGGQGGEGSRGTSTDGVSSQYSSQYSSFLVHFTAQFPVQFPHLLPSSSIQCLSFPVPLSCSCKGGIGEHKSCLQGFTALTPVQCTAAPPPRPPKPPS